MNLFSNTFALAHLLSLSCYWAGCSTKTVFGSPLMAIDTAIVKIMGYLKLFLKMWKVKKVNEGFQAYTLSVTSLQEAMLPVFNLEWNFPTVDGYSIWDSEAEGLTLNYNDAFINKCWLIYSYLTNYFLFYALFGLKKQKLKF